MFPETCSVVEITLSNHHVARILASKIILGHVATFTKQAVTLIYT